MTKEWVKINYILDARVGERIRQEWVSGQLDRVDLWVEREVPGVPTEPGLYLDNQGDLWLVDDDGKIDLVLDVSALNRLGHTNSYWTEKAANYAPFIKAEIVEGKA